MVRNLSESSKKKKKNAAQEADGCKEIGQTKDKERVEAKETPSKKQEGLEADCRFASNESSCRNLEKLVRKMHRTADIFSLEDQTLKFSILKEVLECQRLLLTNTLSGQRPSLYVSSDEVYDEWKLLAMVVDRVCFFLYVFTLVGSSVAFFSIDHYYNSD